MATSGEATSIAPGNINEAGVDVTKIRKESQTESFSQPERAILVQWVEDFKTSNREARTTMMRRDVFPAFRKLNLHLNDEQWILRKGVR